jgi:hypothetical protein
MGGAAADDGPGLLINWSQGNSGSPPEKQPTMHPAARRRRLPRAHGRTHVPRFADFQPAPDGRGGGTEFSPSMHVTALTKELHIRPASLARSLLID